MVADNATNNHDEPPFTMENNILIGKTAKLDSQYTNVGQLLYDTLKRNPDFVGQVDAITNIQNTFGEIVDRAIKCALWMQKHGVGKGDIVAISSHNHLDSVIPCIAALFLGAIMNPWNNEMNIQLARHFMTLTQPKVVFANEKSVGIVLEAAKIELYHTEVVCFGSYPGTTSFADALTGHAKSSVENFKCKDTEPSQTALILFSSGTTGMPKGVQLPHRAMLNVLQLNAGLALNSQTPLWFSSLYWISGSLLSLKSITSCTKRIIGPDFDEQTACEIVEKFKVTWMMLSTSMANRFVRFSGLHRYDLSSLNVLFTGGATLKAESQDLLKKHLPHAIIMQAYGMTELGGLVSAQLPHTTSGSCGVVATNCMIKIVDQDTGETLGPNQNGELCAKTWSLMTGYLKNPEATRNTIDKDGWLHSGDLAYYNEEGELFIIDRLKELIKYRGHHVSPNEIENLLQSHPAVLEVAVVSIPHPIDDEHPVAFVSKIPNKDVSAEELMKMVEHTLMDACRLRGGVKFLPSLPHTHSGKIARKELKVMAKELAIC